MIGDLILFCKRVYRQTFCIHHYEADMCAVMLGLFAYRKVKG